MPENLPVPISAESDLSLYEEYLNREFQEIIPQKPQNYLLEFLNCLVKIDCGNTNIVGVLEHIGNDFLIIISQNKRKTAVALNNVKFITILQKGTKYPYF